MRPEKKSKADKSKESEVWLRTLEKMGRSEANWVSVGDRANDIYDFLHNANRLGWKYVVRARHDRKVEIDGEQTRLFSWNFFRNSLCLKKLKVFKQIYCQILRAYVNTRSINLAIKMTKRFILSTKWNFERSLWIRKQTGKCTSALHVKAKGEEFGGDVTLEITWIKAKLLPPEVGDSTVDEEVTYIRVWCLDKPNLEWLLVKNVPVNNQENALRVVRIYRRRRLIEDYHKAIKTGFRIEDNQLKQASRILALFGMIGVIATQLLAIREGCRLYPETPVKEQVPKPWITLIERCLKVKLKTVKDFWHCLARLGGFIGRKSDGEPGWQTIWKGYKRLQDMLQGVFLGCGC